MLGGKYVSEMPALSQEDALHTWLNSVLVRTAPVRGIVPTKLLFTSGPSATWSD